MWQRETVKVEGSQCGGNFSLIPNVSLEKKTTRVKPRECSAHGKVFPCHSSLNRHVRCHPERKPCEYEDCGEKLYKCKDCGKAFRCHQFCEAHEKNHNREKKYKCKACGGKHSIVAHPFGHTRGSTQERSPMSVRNAGTPSDGAQPFEGT